MPAHHGTEAFVQGEFRLGGARPAHPAIGRRWHPCPRWRGGSFTIEPGTLNYIGQIRVGMHPELELERHPRSGTPADRIQVADREAEARAALAAETPQDGQVFGYESNFYDVRRAGGCRS